MRSWTTRLLSLLFPGGALPAAFPARAVCREPCSISALPSLPGPELRLPALPAAPPAEAPQRPHQPGACLPVPHHPAKMFKYHPTSISGDVHSVCEQLPTGRILHCSSVSWTFILWSFWQWGLQPQPQHASSHDKCTDDDTNTGFHLRPLLLPLLRPAWGEGCGTCHCPRLVSLVLPLLFIIHKFLFGHPTKLIWA